MPEGTQTHFRSIVTDPYLRAIGSDGTIIALGDGATVEQVCGMIAPRGGVLELRQDLRARLAANYTSCPMAPHTPELIPCFFAMQLKSLDKASELFDKADVNGDGKLQVRSIVSVLFPTFDSSLSIKDAI